MHWHGGMHGGTGVMVVSGSGCCRGNSRPLMQKELFVSVLSLLMYWLLQIYTANFNISVLESDLGSESSLPTSKRA